VGYCSICPAGTYSSQGAEVCTKCPNNKTSNAGASFCI
jgi:hypothetical protein